MTSKQHDTHHTSHPAKHESHPAKHAEPEHKKAAAVPAFNEDALAILRAERTRLDAFANSPEASKSGESIEAHAKVAFLDMLITQIEAASASKVD